MLPPDKLMPTYWLYLLISQLLWCGQPIMSLLLSSFMTHFTNLSQLWHTVSWNDCFKLHDYHYINNTTLAFLLSVIWTCSGVCWNHFICKLQLLNRSTSWFHWLNHVIWLWDRVHCIPVLFTPQKNDHTTCHLVIFWKLYTKTCNLPYISDLK